MIKLMIKLLILLGANGLLSINVIAADLPGRLFYTPQQRAAKKPVVTTPRVSEGVSYQGYVKRSDGVNTLWINGQARLSRTQTDVAELKQAGAAELKPGQHYDARQHKAQESYMQTTIAPVEDVLQWQPPNLDKYDAY